MPGPFNANFTSIDHPFINVKIDYGAKGDGLSDDTAAIMAAITAVSHNFGGGTVYFPAGTYLLTGIVLSSLSNIRFDGTGPGSVLKLAANNTSDILKLTSCNHCTISNLTFDCNCSQQTQGTNEDLQSGVHLVSCTFVNISGVRVLNSYMSGIRLGLYTAGTGGCTDIAITNCVVYNVSTNYVAGTSDPDQGIGIWNSQRVSVTNCTINNGGWGGIVLTKSDYCSVVGNTSYNNVYRIGGATNGGHGIALEGARWCTINGNVCYGNNVNGIHLENDPQSGSMNSLDCVIEGNTCTGNINGFYIGHASRCVVAGNTCNNNSQSGIQTSTNADTCVIQGNLCEGNTLYGFWIKASNCDVVANVARNNTQQGFFVQNVPTNLVFAENFSTSNGQAGFDIRGTTSCAIIGNVSTGSAAGAGFIIQDDAGNHNTLAVLSNNVSDGNSNEGIILLNCTGFVISGNFSSGNHGSGGLDLRGVQYSSITGNTIMNNNGAGITLEDNGGTFCLYNIVEGNNCSDSQGTPTQTWGIQEVGTSNNNRIQSNACRNNTTGQLKVTGAATVSRFNTGLVTEAHGTATIGAASTSIVVTHGLALTPTLEQISVTPQGSLLAAAKFWVSTPTGTQFTINVDAAPGGAGIVFGWKCDVGY